MTDADLEKIFKNRSEKAEFNFIQPSVLHKDLAIIFDPDKMIEDLSIIEDDIDFEFTGDYAQDVCSLCKNATAWAIIQLEKTSSEIKNDIKIIDGNFGWGEHTWLIYKDRYYIDLTLAQFLNYAPKLSILEVSDKIRTEHRSTLFDSVEKYREWGRETIEEWKQHL